MDITEVKDDIVIVEDVFNEEEYNYLFNRINKGNLEFRYAESYSLIPELETDNNEKTPCYVVPLLGQQSPQILFLEYSLISFLSKHDNFIFNAKMIGDARYTVLQKQEDNVEPEKTIESQNQDITQEGKTAIYFPNSSDTNIIIYDAKFDEKEGYEVGLEETKIIKKIKGVKNSVVIFDSKYFHAFETKNGNSNEFLIFNYWSDKENTLGSDKEIENYGENLKSVSV